MGLETDFDYLNDLNVTWPEGTDPVSEGDNHIAGVKNAIRSAINNDGTFTSLFLAGAEAVRLEGAAAKFLLRYIDVLSSLDIATGLRVANNEGGFTLTTDAGEITVQLTDAALAVLGTALKATASGVTLYSGDEPVVDSVSSGAIVKRGASGGATSRVRLADALDNILLEMVAVDGAYTGFVQFDEGIPFRIYVREAATSRLMADFSQASGSIFYGPEGIVGLAVDGNLSATRATRARVYHKDGSAYEVGMNVMPPTDQGGSRALTQNDGGKAIRVTSQSTLTVPSLAVGTCINVLKATTGIVALSPSTGVVLNCGGGIGSIASGSSVRLTDLYDQVSLYYRAANEVWVSGSVFTP